MIVIIIIIILRYKMYLHLKKKNPKTFLVPCYDIDLVWHAHQVHPQAGESNLQTKSFQNTFKSAST